MEVVRAFNNELSSLYEVKPPISKAKMTQITKSAIKGIKYYKHIVQSVEKFIQKCRPEYKVPGLYAVDSIVRQSRHQFGADKDVFGPRFVKNINATFQHLFKCNPDDRPKIIRVLNLWQKNAVFPIDIIQPLLDMGHPNSAADWPNDSQNEVKESPRKVHPGNEETQGGHHKSDSQSWKGWPQANDEPASDTHPYAEMSTKNLEKFMKAEMSHANEEEVQRSSLYRNQVKQEKLPEENTVQFNTKLLDFDYGDEEDEEEAKNEDNLSNTPNALALSLAQNFLSNPDILRHLQQMQQTIQQNETSNSDGQQATQSIKPEVDASFSSDLPSSPPQQPPLPTYEAPHMPLPPTEADKDDRVLPQPPLPPQDLDERSLAAIMTPHRPLPPTTIGAYLPTGTTLTARTEADKDDRILPEAVAPPRDLDERSLTAILAPLERSLLPPMQFTEASAMNPYQGGVPFPSQQPPLPMMEPMSVDAAYPPALPPDQHLVQGKPADEDERVMYSMPGEPPLPPQDFDERTLMIPVEERVKKERSRSRSGSRSRGRSGRHRSRSKSPRRKRSRSRSRSRKSSRAEERERIREKERERERERDRKKKGLPPIKKGCVSVCSTTLWLGHVPKSCTESDISDTFGEFGTILSIDMIPPRGCAFVVMDRRQDAHRAIQKLKNLKLQSSSVKMAWAPGKGVKGKEYKTYWEVSDGVSYVPFDKISENAEALDLLEEGGFIDEESLPENLKALRNQTEERSSFNAAHKASMETVTTTFNAVHAPPMVRPPIMPPTSVNLPGMVLPHLMQPQFGLPSIPHLPGLLPPQAMVMQVPMGIPPPNPMLMVQQQSQNMLNPQSLQMGMPQMIPRAVPPVASALQNLKTSEPTVNSPVLSSTNAGDATPTEEDGTSVSSPSTVHLTNTAASSTMTITTQQAAPITQFNPLLGMQNVARPMMSVPPPVSSAGTPIPYPPPNVNFNFPPPGVRPPGPGQAPPNHQFPWMHQKPVCPPFTNSDSSHSTNSRVTSQPGMPPHMFANRPPFQEKQLPPNQPAAKDAQSTMPERKSNDLDNSGNRSSSPGHHDMVISTDDESSLDHDYPRNNIDTVPRFQGPTEFPRMPMPMHHMRGPPGPMQGMRFQRGGPMAPPFHMRMGGPRNMNMHPGHRMEMDFSMHHGPRMPSQHKGDGMPPHQEGRDWYPPDFDGPPYERDNRYDRGDWKRDSWVTPDKLGHDRRRPSFDHEDKHMRNDHNDKMQDFKNPRKEDRTEDQGEKYKNNTIDETEQSKQNKKPSKSLLEDMYKLRCYQGDKDPEYISRLNRRWEPRKKEEHNKFDQKNNKEKDNFQKSKENCVSSDKTVGARKEVPEEINKKDQFYNSRKDKDRESRKRSRWGRTLSEEREFQEQKRNEIEMKRCEVEMKFQSYEQSSREVQLSLPNSSETKCDNSNELVADDTSEVIDCPIEEDNSQNSSEVTNNLNPVLEKSESDKVELSKSNTQQSSDETLTSNDVGVKITDDQTSECTVDNNLMDISNVNESPMVTSES